MKREREVKELKREKWRVIRVRSGGRERSGARKRLSESGEDEKANEGEFINL